MMKFGIAANLVLAVIGTAVVGANNPGQNSAEGFILGFLFFSVIFSLFTSLPAMLASE